jgi:archaellum component FlaC
MKNNIQTLEKEAKSLTEIINTLSEELRYNGTMEEVRKADCLCADKFKSKNTISCICDQIKPQLLVVQNELSSVKTITDTIREELKSMKQTTYENLFPAIRSSGVKSRN